MGLLSALNLPRPKAWPPITAESQAGVPHPATVGRRAETAAAGGGASAGQYEDESESTRIFTQRGRPATEAPTRPTPTKDAAGADSAPTPVARDNEADPASTADERTDEATPTSASNEPERQANTPVAADAQGDKAATPAPSSPTTKEVGYGDFSLGLKESADGASLIVKYEHKEPIAAQNFKVWVIPCYIKADLKIGIEGEIIIKGKGDRQLNIKSGGALELGVGGTSEAVTAGPYSEVALSGSTKVPTRLSEAREIAMNPFVVDVYGTGKVGIKFELKNSWTSNSDCELANWHLFIVHFGAYRNGAFGPIRVEPGKDMQRLIAALQKAGPAIANAVEKYAPEKVKKAAEDGAKWVAESEDAKKIADATGVVLDKVKEKTGVDIGSGAESVVRDLVDPGGETSAEATRRVQAEMAALNASHEDFMKAVQTLGLAPGGEFQSQTQADADEYNAIVEVHQKEGNPFGGTPVGAWKPMLVALATKRRAKKAALLAQQAEKKRRDKADSDAQAVADLARRVKASEAAMNAALTAANMLGNPLNNRTQGQPGSKARRYWETGMNKFWSPGSAARLKCASLQGEAKIAKAQEATALLIKARAVFQEGMRMIE